MSQVLNTKTNNIGTVVSKYSRTSDGVVMYKVITLSGCFAYWIAKNCEAV